MTTVVNVDVSAEDIVAGTVVEMTTVSGATAVVVTRSVKVLKTGVACKRHVSLTMFGGNVANAKGVAIVGSAVGMAVRLVGPPGASTVVVIVTVSVTAGTRFVVPLMIVSVVVAVVVTVAVADAMSVEYPCKFEQNGWRP